MIIHNFSSIRQKRPWATSEWARMTMASNMQWLLWSEQIFRFFKQKIFYILYSIVCPFSQDVWHFACTPFEYFATLRFHIQFDQCQEATREIIGHHSWSDQTGMFFLKRYTDGIFEENECVPIIRSNSMKNSTQNIHIYQFDRTFCSSPSKFVLQPVK